MRFVYPDIDAIFDTDIPKINTLIIESPEMMYSLVTDVAGQINGSQGRAVLSEQGKILDMSKNAEILSNFFSFDISSKVLTTKIISEIESAALSEDNYVSTMELLSNIERHIREMARNLPCNIDLPKISYSSIIKSTGLSIMDDSNSISEKLFDYMLYVKELIGNRFFITINLRDFINDREVSLLLESIISHKINVLMIESNAKDMLYNEKRHIIDEKCCLIE